jgi:hypothetical protein
MAMTVSTTYGIKSAEYLKRARELLDKGDFASLFYAAFELRCGIEARLKEYLDAQAQTSKQKRKGWRIEHLAKQIESLFELSDKGLKLTILDAENNSPISALLYTPVTPQLRKLGEQLGFYLHSQSIERKDADLFWTQMRKKLEMAYQELGFATSGLLMAPPLVHPTDPGKRFFCIAGDQRSFFPLGKRVGLRYEVYEIEPLNEKDF